MTRAWFDTRGSEAAEVARLRAELDRLTARLEEETQIVDRIWDQLGSPKFETLNGRSIYDLIEELKKRAEAAEALVRELKEALAHAENGLQIFGSHDIECSWMPERKECSCGLHAAYDALRAALKERGT